MGIPLEKTHKNWVSWVLGVDPYPIPDNQKKMSTDVCDSQTGTSCSNSVLFPYSEFAITLNNYMVELVIAQAIRHAHEATRSHTERQLHTINNPTVITIGLKLIEFYRT